MMPGDLPCNAPCHNRWCLYELYGQCTDNAPCERQMDEVIKRLDDAISEEQRRKMATTENSSAVGDAAKLREFARLVSHMNDDGYWNGSASICALVDKARAALDAPPRNCDVGTAEEQRVRFEAWCEKQPERYCKACAECPTQRYAINCFCKWAQMPYEEGGDK